MADAATWLGVDLDEVADGNLTKIARRWDAHDLPFPEVSGSPPLGSIPSSEISRAKPEQIGSMCYQAPANWLARAFASS